MNPIEYVFHIDVFTPETIPMARLAEYMAGLAKILGHQEHVHFVRIEKGSAQLVQRIDAVDAPKVDSRLRAVAIGTAPKEALKGFDEVDRLLAEDNGKGRLTASGPGGVVIPFPGRDRPKPLTFPPFWQDGSVRGQLVSIGGRDETAHAMLQDGDVTHTKLNLKRDLARRLAPLIYGPTLRLNGRGRWERQPDGPWTIVEFRVDDFEELDDRPLREVLASIRNRPGNALMAPDAYERMVELRGEDET